MTFLYTIKIEAFTGYSLLESHPNGLIRQKNGLKTKSMLNTSPGKRGNSG
jgi:hypothetical protein